MAITETQVTVNNKDISAKIVAGKLDKKLNEVEIYPTKSLKGIHELLKIKQTLKLYTKNTNKKYHTNLSPTQALDNDMYELILFNSLGKFRMHSKQMAYVREKNRLKHENEALKDKVERSEQRTKRAEQIAEKDNLKNAYIECLEMYQAWQSFSTGKKQVKEYLTKIGIKYAGYMKPEGINKIFSDRVEWFKRELSK